MELALVFALIGGAARCDASRPHTRRVAFTCFTAGTKVLMLTQKALLGATPLAPAHAESRIV